VPRPSVLCSWYSLPVWARVRKTAAVLPAVLLVLLLPGAARAGGGGGVPSPDASTQIAPDPAPSGGEFGSHGAGGQAPQRQSSTPTSPRVTPSNPGVSSSTPASGTPTSTVHAAPAAHSKHRHRHQPVHHARHAPRAHVEASRRVPAFFASSLGVAFHVPAPAPSDAAGESGDVLLFAAIALLLFVFSGLMVVRTTAQAMHRERPA
jgi:hypothetical protein